MRRSAIIRAARPVRAVLYFSLTFALLLLFANTSIGESQPQIRLIDHQSWGEGESGTADGPLETARFNRPQDMTVLADGRLIVADTFNHCIRQIDTFRQQVTTVLGKCGYAGTNYEPTNESHTFDDPEDVLLSHPAAVAAVPGSTNFLVADTGNKRIFQVRDNWIDPIFNETMPAAQSVTLKEATGLAALQSGEVFVADRSAQRILEIPPSGEMMWIAGSGSAGYTPTQRDAIQSRLNGPVSLCAYTSATSGFLALLVGDSKNGLIRQLRTGETIPFLLTNFAGSDNQVYWQEQDGAGQSFKLDRPYRMSLGQVAGGEVLFVTQPTENRILAIWLTRYVQILTDTDLESATPSLPAPAAIAFNRYDQTLWVFDADSRLHRFKLEEIQ